MSLGNRRLAAIMFTDMVGYTALGQRNESLSLALVEEQRKLLRPIFSRHQGREVKTIGDAFLVEFPSALEAVRCSYDIQRATREFNLSVSEDSRIHLRVGVHVGDVEESQGDISGDAVNVASRIEPLAEDGGVCLTQQVYDHVKSKFDLPISRLGTKSLKNVSSPLEVYYIVMPWDKENPSAPQLDSKRVAVLPFVNISPDPDDEYFADGLTEELITKLSGIPGLRVIARTSVMNYKKKEKNVSEIGAELEVGSIIEGSVRKAGNKIRVTVQLIDSRSEEHLWARTYDKELNDIFVIQSDVAPKVADSISSGILFKSSRKETSDIEAYTLYLRAKQLLHEGTEPSTRDAIGLLDRAIEKDPAFALAFAELSRAWANLSTGGYEEFTVVKDKAEPAARRALELGQDLAEPHAAMANVAGCLDRFDEAVAEAKEAVGINPNLAEAHLSLGILYCDLPGPGACLSEFQKAYELDPLSYKTSNLLSLVARLQGNMDLSLDVLERMKKVNPRIPALYASLAEWHMMKGDFEKAQQMLDTAREINPREPIALLDQGILYALTRRRGEAKECLQNIMSSEKESVRLMGKLYISVALGNLEDAFSVLMRQAETHSWPFAITIHPLFEELRKDKRFMDFCLKAGIQVNPPNELPTGEP